jgi:hypothetical protein
MLAMAAALGLVTVTLSQCRLVNDSVTGVDLVSGRLSNRSTCKKACDETFKAQAKAEEDRFKDAKRACGSDKDCKKAVEDDHKNREDGLRDDREKCKKGCYNEGGGQGGR